MATKQTAKAQPTALRELQALARRLQRELNRRQRLATGTINKLEKDLRGLAALLAKRATAVRADVEKHVRGLRRDLVRQAKVSSLARQPAKKKSKKAVGQKK